MADPEANALPANMCLIDALHGGQSHVIGVYTLLGDQPALVDPGPASTLRTVEAGLAAHGLALSDLRAILLTHIHLDHAGATGTLVARNPDLRVYVHQRGAPHMIAPERLLRSAARLYGSAMETLWGEFLAVPEGNITALAGGESIRLGDRRLRVVDAPGHASHHVVFFDEQSGAAFVGDTAGVRMPGLLYARPATPPPDIDLEAWRRTLDALRALAPTQLLITHFGPQPNPVAHIEEYWARLMHWAEAVRSWLDQGLDEMTQIERLRVLAEQELPGPTEQVARYQHATPIEQNWQGLARYWRKRTEQH